MLCWLCKQFLMSLDVPNIMQVVSKLSYELGVPHVVLVL